MPDLRQSTASHFFYNITILLLRKEMSIIIDTFLNIVLAITTQPIGNPVTHIVNGLLYV